MSAKFNIEIDDGISANFPPKPPQNLTVKFLTEFLLKCPPKCLTNFCENSVEILLKFCRNFAEIPSTFRQHSTVKFGGVLVLKLVEIRR